ncbi:hypothetical protein [Azospirillum sp. INR13]|uniref:hypothetical protein n=1 Tax=Azospirillum sp. INR13 TaxID=2596919 RepID=UPI00351C045A
MTGEQYSSLVSTLTTAWSRAQGVLGALRQGQTAVEQAVDANWRPTLDARLTDAGLSGAAIAALRPTWQAVIDGARGGTASAGQMRGALAALDAQLTAGTITAEQHRAAVGVLTAAWADNTAVVSVVTQQLSTSWSEVMSGLVEGWRTVASDSRQAATAWSGVADALEQASRDVMLDRNLSNLGPRALRDAAQAEFARLRGVVSEYAAAVQAGTATDAQRVAALAAAQQIDEAGKKYLEAQRAYSGDGAVYDQSLTDVRAAWDASRQLGLTLKDAETRRADQIDRQIDQLERLTGVSSASRELLDQIKGTITAGNADMSQLVALVRQLPGYQRYSAPTDVQAAWDRMSGADRSAVARQLGYSGSVDAAAFNDFLQATGKGSAFEAAVRSVSARTPTLSPEQQYMAAYPDVAGSGMSAAEHYAVFGAREGRNSFGMTLNRDQAYLARYPDVASAYARGEVSSAAEHYRQHGAAEGRAYQHGGVVGGVVGNGLYGIDSVTAEYAGGGRIWLAGREGILTAAATDAIGGAATIDWINRHRALPTSIVGAYQSGGVVGGGGWADAPQKPAAVVIDMAPVVTAVGTVRSAVLEIGGQIAAMAARLAGMEDSIDNQSAEIRMLGNRLAKLVQA